MTQEIASTNRLREAAELAHALQRQLILPNAAGPHYSVCFSLPIQTELETSVLGANASTWDPFLRYAERRALLRHPLSARAVILGDSAGSEPLSDVVSASVPLSALREWPCLRPAGLAVRKQDPPLLVRPGMAAKSRSPAGLSAHRDLIYSTLHDVKANVIVLFWPLSDPIYDLPPLIIPPPMVGAPSLRLNWADMCRTTMAELGTVMILLWDTDASSDTFCLDAAAEAIGDHPDTDAILGALARSQTVLMRQCGRRRTSRSSCRSSQRCGADFCRPFTRWPKWPRSLSAGRPDSMSPSCACALGRGQR